MASLRSHTDRAFRHYVPEARSWDDETHVETVHSFMEDAFHGHNEQFHVRSFGIAEMLRHLEEVNSPSKPVTWDWVERPSEWHTDLPRFGDTTSSSENLRQRLANANDYFRRKASEVFNDKAALALLNAMYQDVVVGISKFDSCEHGLSLAKLTAANFCEVGAKVIYITEAGQRFIDSLRTHENPDVILETAPR